MNMGILGLKMSQQHLAPRPRSPALCRLSVLFLLIPCSWAQAQTPDYTLAQRLQPVAGQAYRASVLADNGDVAGYTVKPNGTTTKVVSENNAPPNSPISFSWLSALYASFKTVKVPMADVSPVVWLGGVPSIKPRYLNSTSTWPTASLSDGKWQVATWPTSGRIEQSAAFAANAAPAGTVTRTWLESGTYSAMVGGNASAASTIKMNASGSVLLSNKSGVSLTVGNQKTAVTVPAPYSLRGASALAEDNSVLLGVNLGTSAYEPRCLVWRAGTTTEVAVATGFASPRTFCVGMSRDGVVVGHVDDAPSGFSLESPRPRVYFAWQNGRVVSQTPVLTAPNEYAYGLGVSRGGAVALVVEAGGQAQLIGGGQRRALKDALSPHLATGDEAVPLGMNDGGSLLVQVFNVGNAAGADYRVFSPRP
ncbi:MAG: hypothetical protein RI907_3300 [Pseudomonadota bacterium]|jgi:hypothetical protein